MREDSDEAAIIVQAGAAGRVMVATIVPGRGTDIALPAEVVAAGGLHVIATEGHDSRRIDRQLFGRVARAPFDLAGTERDPAQRLALPGPAPRPAKRGAEFA